MQTIIITLFIAIIVLREWSLAYRVKSLLGLSQFKSIKVLECFPCFCFWTSIIVAYSINGSIIDVLATYVVASIIDKLWN